MGLRRAEGLARRPDIEPEDLIGGEARGRIEGAQHELAAALQEIGRYTDVPDDAAPAR